MIDATRKKAYFLIEKSETPTLKLAAQLENNC
jgi:hypothetical protein